MNLVVQEVRNPKKAVMVWRLYLIADILYLPIYCGATSLYRTVEVKHTEATVGDDARIRLHNIRFTGLLVLEGRGLNSIQINTSES